MTAAPLYFDYNASAPMGQAAIEAMTAVFAQAGNPSAPHRNGRAMSQIVSTAREQVGAAMGVCANDIIFTGSGTEAVNTAIWSALNAGCKRLFVSSMDHPASLNAAKTFGSVMGADIVVETMPVYTENDSKTGVYRGGLNLNHLSEQLENWDAKDGKPFVCLSVANSEIGIIQDLEPIADLVHERGGFLIIDAVQGLGKLRADEFGAFSADYLAVSAHKIGGPQGVGALFVNPDAPFFPLLNGGGQEKRRRAGTMNVAGIAGFGAACSALGSADDLALKNNKIKALRDKLESKLQALEPDMVIFGQAAPRLANTLYFALPDLSSSSIMMLLDLEGICVTTGMACSSGKTNASLALSAMGVEGLAPKGAVRISLGTEHTDANIDEFLVKWVKIRGLALKGAA